MDQKTDGVIWMINSLVFICHIALVHVGLRQDMVSNEWIGSTTLEYLGVLGYTSIIIFFTLVVSFMSYLLLKNYKIYILSAFSVALSAILFYNLYLAFN